MTFNVKSDKNISAEQLKKKVQNALLNDIDYPVLNIEDKTKSPTASKKQRRPKNQRGFMSQMSTPRSEREGEEVNVSPKRGLSLTKGVNRPSIKA